MGALSSLVIGLAPELPDPSPQKQNIEIATERNLISVWADVDETDVSYVV